MFCSSHRGRHSPLDHRSPPGSPCLGDKGHIHSQTGSIWLRGLIWCWRKAGGIHRSPGCFGKLEAPDRESQEGNTRPRPGSLPPLTTDNPDRSTRSRGRGSDRSRWGHRLRSHLYRRRRTWGTHPLCLLSPDRQPRHGRSHSWWPRSLRHTMAHFARALSSSDTFLSKKCGKVSVYGWFM